MRISNVKLLVSLYLLGIVALFFYSFTQVDLGLTLTRWSIWQVYQQFFQHIGYFDRQLSTILYFSILIILFVCYVLFLRLSYLGKLSRKTVWVLTIITAAVLLFSYNAFSYDLFNYIFDAKIVTHYNQNPYEHKALDYPLDPMLGFMHWIQRTYPYGPTWLVITVPLSFLGMQFLLPTIILFKSVSVISYLCSVLLIERILAKHHPAKKILGMVFFAFNPLVIIETLVSAHNDTLMMVLLLLSLYLFFEKKYIFSFFAFVFSVGVKFATLVFVPVFVILFLLQKRRSESFYTRSLLVGCVLMIAAIILASIRTNMQPWYLLYILPIAALLVQYRFVVISSVIMSFSLLLHYVPFLYLGNWDKPVPQMLFWFTTCGIVLSCLVIFFMGAKYFRRFRL